jgi:hypothetical protein
MLGSNLSAGDGPKLAGRALSLALPVRLGPTGGRQINPPSGFHGMGFALINANLRDWRSPG